MLINNKLTDNGNQQCPANQPLLICLARTSDLGKITTKPKIPNEIPCPEHDDRAIKAHSNQF